MLAITQAKTSMVQSLRPYDNTAYVYRDSQYAADVYAQGGRAYLYPPQ